VTGIKISLWQGFARAQGDHRNFKCFPCFVRPKPGQIFQDKAVFIAIGIVELVVARQGSSRFARFKIGLYGIPYLIIGKARFAQRVNPGAAFIRQE
jgi:hypothetical protein